MIDNVMLFEILYALAARDGRQQVLFGDSAPRAREAFCHSTTGHAFPEVWFELPLAGDPWFDLHLLTSQDAKGLSTAPPSGAGQGYQEVFSWFAGAPGVRQLALSWDLNTSGVESPAAQVLVATRSVEVPCAFLDAAGKDELQRAYTTFAGRVPDQWFLCYTGVFPARRADFVRVECIVEEALQRAYAQDAGLLAAHLCQAGLRDIDDQMLTRLQALARSPFPLEFQFDVADDGTPGPTLGASVRFPPPPGTDAQPAFDPDGPAGELMGRIESWGLADERWRQLADTAFAMRVSHPTGATKLYCYPAFVKLRWRGADPLDAKAYLLAGALEQDSTTSESGADR